MDTWNGEEERLRMRLRTVMQWKRRNAAEQEREKDRKKSILKAWQKRLREKQVVHRFPYLKIDGYGVRVVVR